MSNQESKTTTAAAVETPQQAITPIQPAPVPIVPTVAAKPATVAPAAPVVAQKPQAPVAATVAQSLPSFLPSMKTPRVTKLDSVTMLLYGKPKIGKSTFASQFPGALFLPTEPGLNHLSVFQAPADGSGIRDWAHFIAVMTEIAKMNHPFKTLIIDTVDNLHKMCAEHVCKSRQVEYAGDMPHAKGWALVSNEFERVLRRVAQLPMGLILISHATDRETETARGTIVRTIPTLSEGARKSLAGFVDMILYCDVQPETATDGRQTFRRVIRTSPHVNYDAGDRTETLPSVLDLNFNSFFREWSDGQARKASSEANKVEVVSSFTN